MNRQDIEKLLGGYATGTLTPDEEQALFAAALEDQQLFDRLAHEQPLRDLLRDPAARAALLATLNERPTPWYCRFALPLAAAAAVLLIGVPVAVWRLHRPVPPAALIAQITSPPPVQPALESAPAPLPPAASARPSLPQPKVLPEPAPPPTPTSTSIDGTPLTDVQPAAKDAQPLQGELKPGTKTETVEATTQTVMVTAAPTAASSAPAAPLPQAAPPFSATNGFLPAQDTAALRKSVMARALAAQASRLKYTVLSRQPNGEFSVANPADLHAGDTVELRLETQDTGYAYVAEGQALLASSPIEAGKPFDAVIEPHGAGQRQIECWFSPRQMIWPAATVGAVGGVAEGAITASLQQHPPSVRITLNYK